MEKIPTERIVFTEKELMEKLGIEGELEDIAVQSSALGISKVAFVVRK